MFGNRDSDEEEPRIVRSVPLSQIRFYEFDCPNCEANNPMNDGFKNEDEIICLYCGLEFKVKTVSEGRFRLIPI